MANENDSDGPSTQSQSHETLGHGPRETLGSAPGPQPGPPPKEAGGGSPTPAGGGSGGGAPAPKDAGGGSPTPRGGSPTSSGGRNLPLLVGIGVVILAIIAIIVSIAK